MTEVTRVHLDVELELGTETIRGLIGDGTSPTLAFNGWLELMSVLDTVCARANGAARVADSASSPSLPPRPRSRRCNP